MLPNLFVVGAMKCGTTTLYNMLARTPGVAMSRNKEPNHFCTDLYACPDFALGAFGAQGPNWISDRQTYLALFPRKEARWFGEASNTYLYSAVAARRIHDFNPEARIVIALRNPIDRAYSEYLMRFARGTVSAPFSQVIREDHERVRAGRLMLYARYVASGLYAQQIDRYLEVFPRDRMLIEIVDRPGGGFSRVRASLSEFLNADVPAAAVANAGRVAAFPRLNRLLFSSGLKGRLSRAVPEFSRPTLLRAYYSAPKQPMTAADRSFLKGVFDDDIRRLSSMLGEDLSFWLADPPTGSDDAFRRAGVTKSD